MTSDTSNDKTLPGSVERAPSLSWVTALRARLGLGILTRSAVPSRMR